MRGTLLQYIKVFIASVYITKALNTWYPQSPVGHFPKKLAEAFVTEPVLSARNV